jgi:hypothetical protein
VTVPWTRGQKRTKPACQQCLGTHVRCDGPTGPTDTGSCTRCSTQGIECKWPDEAFVRDLRAIQAAAQSRYRNRRKQNPQPPTRLRTLMPASDTSSVSGTGLGNVPH